MALLGIIVGMSYDPYVKEVVHEYWKAVSEEDITSAMIVAKG